MNRACARNSYHRELVVAWHLPAVSAWVQQKLISPLLLDYHTLRLLPLLYEHLTDMVLEDRPLRLKCYSLDPASVRWSWLRDSIRTLLRSHVENRDHIAMRDEHEHVEVEDLAVKPTKPWDAPVNNPVPLLELVDWSHCTKAHSVTPWVLHWLDLKVETVNGRLLCDLVNVLYKFEVKLIEIRFDVNALQQWIEKFIDQAEVMVDFKRAILADYNANLVALSCLLVCLRDGAIFEQLRGLQVRGINRTHLQ